MKLGTRDEWRPPKVNVCRRPAPGRRGHCDSHLAGDLEPAVPLYSLIWQQGLSVTLLVLTTFPARPPCFSTGVSPLQVWYYIVCSCLTCALVNYNNFYMSAHYAVCLKLWFNWLCVYPLLLFFVYACAPSLTNVTYTVFNYLTLSLFPALVQYMRFGILTFVRWLFSDECRVFSAGTRKSTFVGGGVVFPLYGFCQCILSLNACVFCRYTIMHYIYMQVADCTIGFLLYLDAYHLP